MHDPRTLVLPLFLFAAAAPAQTLLQTLYAAGNSLNSPGSEMFDATVLNPEGIVVTGFEINCENTRNGPAGSLFQIDVYATVRGGTYVNNTANPAAWTKVATGTALSNPQGTPTPIDTSDFFLPAGTFGLALNFVIPTGSPGTAFAYTNGNGTNQQYADANLQLNLGASSSGVFTGATYSPRVFNGGVLYEAATNAAYGPYGTGCSGGSPTGAPTLLPAATNGVPRLGQLWYQDLANLPAVAGGGVLVFGLTTRFWGPWQLPVDLTQFGMANCSALVPPDAVSYFTHGGGTYTYLTALPNNPAFAGITMGSQAIVLDAAATNPVAASMTNLTAGRIGN